MHFLAYFCVCCALTLGARCKCDPLERIKFGMQAVDGSFPYIVSLQYHHQHFCGGSIVGSTWIVTAAHCIKDKRSYQVDVLAGTVYRSYIPRMHNSFYPSFRQGVTAPILTGVQHMWYNTEFDSSTNDNDVALLQTKEKLLKSGNSMYINRIGLQKNIVQPGTICTVAGWGKMETGHTSLYLLFATVRIVTHAECFPRSRAYYRSERMICALGDRHEDADQGDSGGPLVCNGRLTGIVSFGFVTSYVTPGVYAKVRPLREWIRNVRFTKPNQGSRMVSLVSPYTLMLCVFIILLIYLQLNKI